MTADAGDEYRVVATGSDSITVLDRDAYDRTDIATTNEDDALADRIQGLRPGYRITATLSWQTDPPTVDALTLDDTTLYTFKRGVSGLFEVALDTWETARQQGLGINSRVTYSNDGHPNGALYTFAAQSGERDLYDEFKRGTRPLDPLLDRVEAQPPYEVFIFDPHAHEFVLVYIVLAKHSILADTVRDTYDCPRPTEPLADTEDPPTDPRGGTDTTDVDLWDLDNS